MSFEDWETLTLNDVCQKITDGAHFSPKDDVGGMPMASVKDLTRFGINISSCRRISKSDFANLVRQGCAPKINDVLIAKDGNSSLDTVCVFSQDDSLVLLSSVAILRPNERITADFLNYYFDNPETKSFLKENFRSGSAIPRVILRDFRNAPIKIPTITVQKKIGKILRSLDDKIELNRQTNQTLEAIAQALFKEWFVDFNFPGATGEMVESELGEIPKGWRVEPLDKIAEFLNGSALQKFPSKSDEDFLPVIKIRELKSGITGNTDKANKSVPQKYIINDGDLLFSWSGTLEVKFWIGGKGALNQHLFKVSSTKYPIWFCYVWTLYHLAELRRIAEDKATTMGHIQRRHLNEALCLIPDDIKLMNSCMEPILAEFINREQQTQTLIKLRESLLPKLMTGEISTN